MFFFYDINTSAENRTAKANMPPIPCAPILQGHNNPALHLQLQVKNRRPAKRISCIRQIQRSKSNLKTNIKNVRVLFQVIYFFRSWFRSSKYGILEYSRQKSSVPLSFSVPFSGENHGERSWSLLRYRQES